ncbi:hypothetical protein AG0111_0g12974 [Alternaria gaisen]|uniref:Uncharacterized protein n=1 Tax=Alternaria gaisen TaxID=167740 RepID=A0ACB6F2V2_9PLEO|nr:hypothetical protein AG0111_0g12974 [Alternaria gaisen]
MVLTTLLSLPAVTPAAHHNAAIDLQNVAHRLLTRNYPNAAVAVVNVQSGINMNDYSVWVHP